MQFGPPEPKKPKAIKPRKKNAVFKDAVDFKLDWKAYFHAFCEEHGEPVEFEGRLLFEDGFTYSATDYAGPEWGPPKDEHELCRLRTAYWTVRRKIVDVERQRLEMKLSGLRQLQSAKFGTLQRKVRVETEGVDERGRPATVTTWESSEIDLAPIRVRINQLVEDVRRCDEQLQALKGASNGSGRETRVASVALGSNGNG